MAKSLSFFSLVTFACVASIADILGVLISTGQTGIISALISPVGQAFLVLSAVAAGLGYVFDIIGIDIGIIDAAAEVSKLLVVLIGIQLFFSVIVLCTYLSLTLASYRSFSLFNFSLVFLVFILESLPILCGFTFWSILAHFFLGRQRLNFLMR